MPTDSASEALHDFEPQAKAAAFGISAIGRRDWLAEDQALAIGGDEDGASAAVQDGVEQQVAEHGLDDDGRH